MLVYCVFCLRFVVVVWMALIAGRVAGLVSLVNNALLLFDAVLLV